MTTHDRLLDALTQFIADHGFSPTVRELADLLEVKSLSTVHLHLQRLQREGRIAWVPQQPRTLRPTNPAEGGQR